MINTKASIWCKNMLVYLPLDIICFLKFIVHLLKHVMYGQICKHICMSNEAFS